MLQDKAEKGDPSVIWSLIKTLRKAKASPKMPLQAFKDLQGNLVPAPETRAEAWRDVFANEFSYQVKTFTRPELQTLLRQRIAEAHTAKALRPAPRMADQELRGDGILAAAHPSACLVSHRAVEGRSLPEPQAAGGLAAAHPSACLVSHRAAEGSSKHHPEALPTTLEEWIGAVATAIAQARNGKALGRDQVTNEIMKAAGPPFVLSLATCLQRIAIEGTPLE